MSGRLRHGILAVVLLAAAWLALAWYRDRESPLGRATREVRTRLQELAAATSFRENDPPFVKLGYPQRLVPFFAPETAFDIQMGARATQGTFTRSQLSEGAAGLRGGQRGLSVEFLDITVTATPVEAPTQATAHLTSKIYFLGDPDYFVQEFRVGLSRMTNGWKIERLETVQTMEP